MERSCTSDYSVVYLTLDHRTSSSSDKTFTLVYLHCRQSSQIHWLHHINNYRQRDCPYILYCRLWFVLLFLSRDAMHTVIQHDTGVRMSVCSSYANIVSKRVNLLSHFYLSKFILVVVWYENRDFRSLTRKRRQIWSLRIRNVNRNSYVIYQTM